MDIDLVELEKLCMLHCSDKELADWFGVTTRTIERRRTEPEFAAVMERGRSKGKISLRRAQMRMAEEGNAVMGIFLGKQWLGQADQAAPDSNISLVFVLPRANEEARDDSIPIEVLQGDSESKYVDIKRLEPGPDVSRGSGEPDPREREP